MYATILPVEIGKVRGPMSVNKKILEELIGVLGADAVLTSPVDLECYSYDATTIWRGMPEVVVLPAELESSMFGCDLWIEVIDIY